MPAVATRERLIQVAHLAFYQHGFQAVGLDRILSEVGVTKTTFYKYFAGKDDLIVAVLQHHDAWWLETLPSLLRAHAGDDPQAQLRSLFDVLADTIARDEFRGCIFHNVAVEFPLPTDPAHRAAVANKRAVERFMTDLAGQAGAAEPRALAEELGLLMEGLFVVRAVDRDNQGAFAAARRTAALLFDKYLPPVAV